MNISAISFTGLVGASRTYGSRNEYGNYCHTVMNYYPFDDETNEETDEFVREHTFHKSSQPETYRDDMGMEHLVGAGFVDSRNVKVLEKLSFTKEEYKKYMSKPEELPMSKRIEINHVLNEIEREKKIVYI